MRQNKSVAVTLFPLLSNAAALHTLLILFAFRDNPIADHKGMLIWWGGLVVCHGVMSLYLQKPRELRSLILLGVLIFALQLGVTIAVNPIYSSFVTWFACVCMWIYGYYQCVVALLNGVKPESLTVNFETTSVTLLVVACISSAGAMAIGTVVHLAIGVLCILIALMRLRTLHTRMDDSEKRPMVGLVVPMILLGAAGCAIAFCMVIGGYAAQLLTRFTAWVGTVLRSVANGIGAFFLWLFSLFPQMEDPTLGDNGYMPDALPSGTADMTFESNGILLYLLIAAVLVALVVLVIMVWRKVRLQGMPHKRVVIRAAVVKKNSLWEILHRLVMAALRRVRFEIRYLQRYNSLNGLLVWLERRMSRRGIKRKTGETMASYLVRIQEAFPQGSECLCELSNALDRYYFCDGAELSKDEIHRLRKALKHIGKQSGDV